MNRRSAVLASAAMIAFGACDSTYGGFLGAVPVEDQRADGPPVQVFLGIDGMARVAFDRARAAGAFAGYHDADFVAPFPAVSDYAWMRMLRAGQTTGYEIQHYDARDNQLHSVGLLGVLEYPLEQGLLDPLPCYRDFDFLGDGPTWTARGYSDPEAALSDTLDTMFDRLVTRARTQDAFLAYLVNVDVVSHLGGVDKAVQMLVEIDRRLTALQTRHPGRFQITLFGDHGNAHQRAELVDPRVLLRESGVDSVETLADGPALQAIPIVHVRVNFVSVHTHPWVAADVAERTSQHRWVDLSVADLGPGEIAGESVARFGLFRKGRRFAFGRTATGDYLIESPADWRELGLDVGAAAVDPLARLNPSQAFERTASGPYPDLLHRVATAFQDRTVAQPPQVILSMPDDVASYGFHLPGGGDKTAVDGFHGALTRGSSVSVLASQARTLPAALRADDLLATFPILERHLRLRRGER